jgi:hypothetical protein
MKKAALLLVLALPACAGLHDPRWNRALIAAHGLRLGLERIPGVVAMADALVPWAPVARQGLNLGFLAGVALTAPEITRPETSLGVSISLGQVAVVSPPTAAPTLSPTPAPTNTAVPQAITPVPTNP